MAAAEWLEEGTTHNPCNTAAANTQHHLSPAPKPATPGMALLTKCRSTQHHPSRAAFRCASPGVQVAERQLNKTASDLFPPACSFFPLLLFVFSSDSTSSLRVTLFLVALTPGKT
jgi:hypothetical protein